ncbi:MAG: MFS transporter [Desulfosarcinaceae bacterium]|nr:MFS transporter [Desulfosarcinaceae bacterium]
MSMNPNRNLALLLGGQFVSQIGDKFHMLAVAYLVLKTTGSATKMGLLLFCSIFPSMLLGIVAGAVLDRCNKLHIIIAADLIRSALVGTLAILYATSGLSFGPLLAAQVLISVCSAFFDPAIPALIPQIVDRTALTRANAQTQLISGIATIIGPVLGGLTVAWGGYLPVFVINAGSYLFSALSECLIRLAPTPNAPSRISQIGGDIVAGCRYVGQRQALVMILGMVAVIHFFVGSIESVIPVLALSLGGDGAANMGVIQTTFGLGIVAAALCISLRPMDGGEERLLFGSVGAIGIQLLIMGGVAQWGVHRLVAYLPLFVGLGIATITAGTSFRSILQKSVADVMLGRVFGFVSSVGNISIPLAALTAGMLLEHYPHAHLLIASGVVLVPLSAGGHHAFRKQQLGIHRPQFD